MQNDEEGAPADTFQKTQHSGSLLFAWPNFSRGVNVVCPPADQFDRYV